MTVWKPKRGREISRVWFCKFRHEGRQFMRSTGQEDEALARAEAEAIYQRVTGQAARWSPELEESGPSLGTYLEVYETAKRVRANPRTRRKNVNDLLAIVRERFHVERERALDLPVQVLCRATLLFFLRARGNSAGAQSMVNHAKAVFSRPARNAYRDAGLPLPEGIAELQDF